jgi:signal transduction histidine kinase
MKGQISEADKQRSTVLAEGRPSSLAAGVEDRETDLQLKSRWIDRADRKDLIDILDNLPHGLVALGRSLGKALYVNRQILVTLGYSPPDTPTSKDLLKKIFPNTIIRRDVMTEWKRIVQAGGGTCTLHQVLCGDGALRVFEIRVTVLRKDLVLSMWTDVTQRQETETRLTESRHLSEYLQRAREEERARIAREVHDEFGQALTGLKMELQYQAQHFPKNKRLFLEQIEAMLEQIDDARETVKQMCAELRPAMLTHFGLLPTIEWYLQTLEKRSGIHCSLKMDSRIPLLGEDLGLAIFRIVQEATTNILRHSGATEMTVGIKKQSGNLMLIITDNGRGISQEEIGRPHSFGIIGIRERVHFWGGQSHIEGIPDRGTVLKVAVPLYSGCGEKRYSARKHAERDLT